MRIGNMNFDVSSEVVVIFFLESNSSITIQDTIQVLEDSWTISIKEGNCGLLLKNEKFNNEVAREEYIDSAYKAAQMFLDILIFKKKQLLFLDHTSSTIFIGNNTKTGRIAIIQTHKQLELQVSSTTSVIARDLESNEIKANEREKCVSHRIAFSYYRMSLKCNNLMDAYRYLYLGLEAALSKHTRWTGSEGKWINEAFDSIEKELSLSTNYNCSLADHFFTDHYKKYRVKLFHSKEDVISPFESFNLSELYIAYKDLCYITDLVFSALYNVRLMTNSVMGEAGVNAMQNALIVSRLTFSLNSIEDENEFKIIDIREKTIKDINKETIKIPRISDLTFNQISFKDKENNSLYSITLKELVQLELIDNLIIDSPVTFLNQSKYDKKFTESFK
ncbi:MAG: hypothetical protein JXR62_05515 [Bacilli bacterium]|nr:hypothetical protein [Bacilli bacterium]